MDRPVRSRAPQPQVAFLDQVVPFAQSGKPVPQPVPQRSLMRQNLVREPAGKLRVIEDGGSRLRSGHGNCRGKRFGRSAETRVNLPPCGDNRFAAFR